MTQAAKLKSVIRARAAKTGESYTAARRHVLASRPFAIARKPSPAPRASQPEALIIPSAREPRIPRGEVSNAAAVKRTGHGLDYWFNVLDRFGTGHGHTRTAEYLYSKHKLPGWYAQSVTVTWERARGLRQENQTCSGDFQVSVSRSIATPVEALVALINEPKTRGQWLAGVDKALRKGMEEAFAAGKALEMKKPGYARMRYKWLSSVVEWRLSGSPNGKSTLVADNSALIDAEAVAARREIFAHALDRLRGLAGPAVPRPPAS